ISKALRKPLVAIGGPPHHVAPPLVRDLMRSHFLDEIVHAARNSTQELPALRGIEKRAQRQVNQPGPRLAESEIRLLRDSEAPIRRAAEPLVVDSHRHLRLAEHLVRKTRWREPAQIVRGLSQIVRNATCGIAFERVWKLLDSRFLFLEIAIIKSSHGERSL